jgi:antitoxin (DNA-binding transcriptional repressor) of toxin-antitoxin stability system
MTTKVAVRDFRAGLAGYIDSDEPVAVTRHGRTVGFFVPTRANVAEEMAAFQTAADRLREALADQGADPDEIAVEFDAARRRKPRA